MKKPIVCVFCSKPTLRITLTNHLEDQYRLLFAETIEILLDVLKGNAVACVIAHPIQYDICRLWQLREIKQQFETVPLIIACPCAHFDFLKACADTLADECVAFDEIQLIPELVAVAIDRFNFQKQYLRADIYNRSSPPRTKKALKIIRSQFTRIKFAEQVSCQLGISVATFRKEFKQLCGTTFTQYLIHAKLLYATYLAQNEGLTGKVIAHRCGFQDEHEFYRCFKRKLGTPFSEYRSKHSIQEFGSFFNRHSN
jgi:AraC-like DNA-binding protein